MPRPLLAGARLSDKRRSRVARRVAELTGLPQALVEEKNLRISDQTYFFEAMRPQGRIVGRLEARATGPMAASRTREWEFDPGIEAIAAPYTMAAMAHFGVRWAWTSSSATKCSAKPPMSPGTGTAARPRATATPAPPRPGPGDAPQPADEGLRGQRPIRSGHALQRQRLVAGATGCAARGAGKRVQHCYYDAGHMMYTRQADLIQLKTRSGPLAPMTSCSRHRQSPWWRSIMHIGILTGGGILTAPA
jgi:hypothetical protein